MGLLEDAAAKRDRNEKEAAGAEVLRIKNIPQLVRLPVLQELAALCLQHGIQPITLDERVRLHVSGVAVQGWVFETSHNTKMAFMSDGRAWLGARTENTRVLIGWRRRERIVERWVVDEPLMAVSGVVPDPKIWGTSWETLATAAAAEILEGRGSNGFIPMNELLRSQQLAQAERDRF